MSIWYTSAMVTLKHNTTRPRKLSSPPLPDKLRNGIYLHPVSIKTLYWPFLEVDPLG